VKTFLLAALHEVALAVVAAGYIAGTSAGSAGELGFSPVRVPLLFADWQEPLDLPPRFRNHCSFDISRGRYYCSDHCGFDYQFYYCSRDSFGCCHIGLGYCGWDGLLRCRP
jgi:hypothetical protein